MENVNKGLIFGFAVIAAVAIGAYAFQFWGWPLSRNPSDWAHFATYLSGTVGVTAVVATLIVLVRTLGQQQALIDSQDKQLHIATRQLALAQSKEAVERAYSNSLNILPLMVESLVERSQKEFPRFTNNEVVDVWKFASFFSNVSYIEALKRIHLIKMAIENGDVSAKGIDSFVDDFFSEVRDICYLAFEQINSNSDMYYIFDNFLKKSLGKNEDVWLLVRCYSSYKLGVEDVEFVEKAIKFLNFEKRDAGEEFEWFGLGEQVKEVVT